MRGAVPASFIKSRAASHARLAAPHEGVNNERRDDTRRGNEGRFSRSIFRDLKRAFFLPRKRLRE